MRKGTSLLDRLPDNYRFSQRDVDAGWEVFCRYFGTKEQQKTVSEAEWELCDFCIRVGYLQKQTHIWPTMAQACAAFQREREEHEAQLRAAYVFGQR